MGVNKSHKDKKEVQRTGVGGERETTYRVRHA